MSCPKCGPSKVMTTVCPSCGGPLSFGDSKDPRSARPVSGSLAGRTKKRSESKVWSVINVALLMGWGFLTFLMLNNVEGKWNEVSIRPVVAMTTVLEIFCVIEVIRMAMSGSGNVALGVALHYTRLFVCIKVWPVLSKQGVGSDLIDATLAAWTLTEICRYPFYIFRSPIAEKVRYFVPILTFPVGAAAEAMSCYYASGYLAQPYSTLALVQVFVNTIGGLMTWPQLIRKGLRICGFIKKKQKKK